MSAPVACLIRRLNAKRSGKGWIAKCPAHEDHTPSLTIGEGADGRVLLHCHAGCETDSVLRALGMTLRDLFRAKYPQPSGNNPAPPTPSKTRSKFPNT